MVEVFLKTTLKPDSTFYVKQLVDLVTDMLLIVFKGPGLRLSKTIFRQF